MQKIYHKKNELFEVGLYQDKECTIPVDFTNAKYLYIELKDCDTSPLYVSLLNKCYGKIYTPYLPKTCNIVPDAVKTLKDITTNLSKYIPEDNEVLSISAKHEGKYLSCFQKDCINEFVKNSIKKLTIYVHNGTQVELQRANEVAKELKEKYGFEEVNLFVLHCFVDDIYNYNSSFTDDFYKQNYKDAYDELCSFDCKPNVSKKEYKAQFEAEKLEHKQEYYINKIITTNSTGILEPQDTEGLQVIDCYDIFEEYLKENN